MLLKNKKNKSLFLPLPLLKEIKKETEIIRNLLEPSDGRLVELPVDKETGITFTTFEGSDNWIDEKNDRIIKRRIQGKIRWTVSDFEECSFFDKEVLIKRKLKEKDKEIMKLKHLIAKQNLILDPLVKKLIHEMKKPGGSEFQKV